jgi:hypothetical protein
MTEKECHDWSEWERTKGFVDSWKGDFKRVCLNCGKVEYEDDCYAYDGR